VDLALNYKFSKRMRVSGCACLTWSATVPCYKRVPNGLIWIDNLSFIIGALATSDRSWITDSYHVIILLITRYSFASPR
jgi:hypothetical protein